MASTTTPIEAALLRAVHDAAAAAADASSTSGSVHSRSLAEALGVGHDEVVGTLKSLLSDALVVAEQGSDLTWQLTEEGRAVVAAGSPEYHVFQAIPADGSEIPQDELCAALGEQFVIGFSKCMKNRWLRVNKAAKTVARAVPSVEDQTANELRNLATISDDARTELKRRQLAAQVKQVYYIISKGPRFALERRRKHAELTKEMLDNNSWATEEFKDFNFDSLGKEVGGGHLHPLLKVREDIRIILLEMGFEEMPTAKWVESSFWNFDSLFQPQSHPARDMHDTFFISDPAKTTNFPSDYLERVRTMHESGGHGSIGYRYDWKLAEAQKNLLRTHTTAISAQMLYRLAQERPFKPRRYFSIDRVFRNEALDATHLAEFHQIEGLVADFNLSLGDLIGTISEFFKRSSGITQLRFKPAYNPYTEPSMEIFGYHPVLKKWTEIGNSGIFRPEMLAPMGLPEGVRVIAWGLSLERPTMIKYRIANIRDLFGHKVKISSIRAGAIFSNAGDSDSTTASASGAPVLLQASS